MTSDSGMNSGSVWRQRLRRGVFLTHLWLGLTLGLWFALVGLSGSVLAWLPDLLPRELAARFPYDRPGAAFVPPSAALAAMRTAHPQAPPPATGMISLPEGEIPYYLFVLPDGRDPASPQLVLVDPTSGRAHSPLRVNSLVLGWIAGFHTSLTKPPTGLAVNGVLAALAVPLLLSGLWLWWPTTARALRQRLTVKPGASLQRRLYDWHNVFGFYTLTVLLVNALTAVLMVADTVTKQGVTHAVDHLAKQPPTAPPARASAGASLPLDVLVARARAAAPGANLTRIMLPSGPGTPFHASFERRGNGLWKGGEVVLDPHTGATLDVQADRAGSAGARFLGLSRDLHFGTYGGVWTQALYSLAGLAPLGLFATGVWKWGNRWRGQIRNRARHQAVPAEETAALSEA